LTEERRTGDRRDGKRASDKVPCPGCQGFQSRVTRCQPDHKGQGFRRVRVCEECGARFWTMERVEKIVRRPDIADQIA
jgi:uncharacterized protein with PIN domain